MRLLFPGHRVDRAAAMVADIRDPAITLLLDLGLIRASSLQIAVADELHIAAVGAFLASIADLALRRGRNAEEDRERCKRQMPPRHGTLLREGQGPRATRSPGAPNVRAL